MNKKKLYVMTGVMIAIFISSMILNDSWRFCIYACIGMGIMLGIMRINLIEAVRNSRIRGILILAGFVLLRICGMVDGFGLIIISLAIISICWVLGKNTEPEKQRLWIILSGIFTGINIATMWIIIVRNAKIVDSFFSGSGEANYIYIVLRRFLNESFLWGRSADMGELFRWLPHYTDACILTTYIATYGKVCGIIIVVIVTGVLVKVLYDMRKSSILGKVITAVCISILALELLVVIMENLMILPFSVFSVFLPFFSQGWQSVILSYILMGCIMSVYRYGRVEIENDLNRVEEYRGNLK